MKILSLFDGMSVAQQAFKELNIPIERYYASETDKYAIAVTQSNFPDTIQLGNITDIKGSDFADIDLIIGGSPCQDLSIAKKNREGLKGQRSGLFYEYVRIRDEVKPKYFILENVNSMPKEAKEQISEILGVQPVMINASLVSAQNRKRLFWISSRLDLCYNCKYEQLLKEIQHRGENTKTQTASVGELLSEKSKEENKVQDLRQTVLSSDINSKMLLKRMYDYQQEKERQQTNKKEERISEKILREKKERIIRIWEDLSQEQQREFSEILQKIHFQAKSKDEKGTTRSMEKKQKDYQYDWERGIVGYVEKNKHEMCFLRFYGGLDGRSYNPNKQGWNERFRELTTIMSELQFIQEGQVNICSCCGGIIPIKYKQVEISQPKDKGILLKDILEKEVDEKYFLSEKMLSTFQKPSGKNHSYLPMKPRNKNGKGVTLTARYFKMGRGDNYIKDTIRVGSLNSGGQGDRIYSQNGKSTALSANGGGRGSKTGLYAVKKSYCLPATYYKENIKSLKKRKKVGLMVEKNMQIRKLTPTECLRLQSMPNNYFDKAIANKKPISNTQKYKMCGNAFNCEVVKHILDNLK